MTNSNFDDAADYFDDCWDQMLHDIAYRHEGDSWKWAIFEIATAIDEDWNIHNGENGCITALEQWVDFMGTGEASDYMTGTQR